MLTPRILIPVTAGLAGLLICLLIVTRASQAAVIPLASADRPMVETGILLDLVTDVAGAAHYDGQQTIEPTVPAVFRQLLFQMNRASVNASSQVSAAELRQLARAARQQSIIPLALLDMDYQALQSNAIATGRARVEQDQLRIVDPEALQQQRLFAAAALVDHSGQGSAVTFQLPAGKYWISNRSQRPLKLEWDLADGRGFVSRQPGERVIVSYASTGRKTLRLRATWADGDVRETSLAFTVNRLVTPDPSAVWNLSSDYSYQGAAATGNAYIYLAPGHTELTRPVLLCEGFDMDNTMFWEELYELGNQQDLVETLRLQGYDMVVLNFTESTEYIQRNGLLLATLLEQINSVIPAGERYPLIGASMGGLVSRYALAWLEQQGVDHQVGSFISFDSPQAGANIPLSIQHWLDFFSDEAEEAAYFLSRLRTPAARQMLLMMAAIPQPSFPGPDPLRQVLLDDLAALGDYPAQPRKVAVANGSGSGLTQGFAAGAQIISYVYRSFLVDIDGNSWSLADNAPQTIFDGEINQIWPFPDRSRTISINGAPPWDNAPGGFRSSMTDLDQSSVPYGDIIALHPNHAFIPTTSALGLVTQDPFRQIEGAADLYQLSPFDELYYPLGANQEHVEITEGSLWWFLQEIVPELDAPQLAIQLVEGTVQLSWNPVPLARSYRVQATADPFVWPAGFVSTGELSWSGVESDPRLFYRVTASMEPLAAP